MSRAATAGKLGGFVLAAAALFAGAWGLGATAGPAITPAPTSVATTTGGQHGEAGTGAVPVPVAETGIAAKGLSVSQEGYTFQTVSPTPTAGIPTEFAFRILGPNGAPVTSFTPTHDKPLHLIVVRRDMAGFQHVHPVMDPTGVWRTPLRFAPGDYRLFADIAPDGRTEAITLGRDLAVPGVYRPVPLPAPATTATTADGYTVTLSGALVPGQSSPVTLTVSKNGRPVTDLQPYLGAYGHLVALRQGDLGYLHVHPEGMPGDGRTPPGPQIGFGAEVPTAGTYRLFLDFQHQGVVRTAAFTATATGPTPGAPGGAGAAPAAPAPGGHGGDGHGH